MSAGYVMALHAERQGWSLATQLDLALRYINNQDDDGTFEDFLARAAVCGRDSRVYMEVRNGVWELVDEAKAGVSESDKDWLIVVYDGLDLVIGAWIVEANAHRMALEEATAEAKRMEDTADWTATLLVDGPAEGNLWLVVTYDTQGWLKGQFAVEGPRDDAQVKADMEVGRMANVGHWRMISIGRA